jgi:ubiquinone/menaquinone biosynthesis C-methylase UbiE
MEKIADYDPIASLYAETFSDITLRRDECNWVEKMLLELNPKKVLDIGCGNGALLAHFASNFEQGFGVDISSAAIKIAKQSYSNINNILFSTIDGTILPFKDNSFDMIISMLSFRYLDWDAILKEMIRVLSPGKHILIVDMVASSVRVSEWHLLATNKLKNFWYLRKHKNFKRALRLLVNDPAWKKMISRHPMHLQSKFTSYLQSYFPKGKMTVLNIGRRAKILAFDSGQVK